MQQAQNSGRNVLMSRDDSTQPKTDKSNRLFSVLKGSGAAPRRQEPNSAQMQVEAPGVSNTNTEPKKGRKRNRSKTLKVDNEGSSNKAAIVDRAADLVATANHAASNMVVSDDQAEKPAHLTDHEFASLPISVNTKRALAEKMRYK